MKVAKDKFGRVDVLYANAGVMPAGPMSGLKVNEWKSIVNISDIVVRPSKQAD